jgi:hypothetical protein
MGTIRSQTTQQRKSRGASSFEYILILAVIVLPIGMLLPVAVKMMKTYSARSSFVMRLPFP